MHTPYAPHPDVAPERGGPSGGQPVREPAKQVADTGPLANPVRAALTGPHAHFAETRGRALRYPPEVAGWAALPDDPEPADWADLAALVGPGGEATFAGLEGTLPEGWESVFRIDGVQLLGETVRGEPDEEAVELGPADVPEMLDLVARTRPGPFLPRTVELGTYLGIRREGVLVAMAGERLRPAGWTEISAVCTDPAYRGQGLAARLVLAVSAGVRERGEIPLLHTGADNAGAIRVYERLGFTLSRKPSFRGVRAPGA
ncbi:Mycothiol acetyltransferase [Streptomyces sp. YIM 130001]|uniref:GNAT family N-acetyltransferase n=1 Tax=Streptomyces sp. YIM 130001 TaxID=2259644 RepID=UPI000E659791|nr:GNAT family N-acetyltransferase [Streptomyces sp. YIM 130001]RII14603.1 Mycothiol acetyltransferase [Streptomyces sp. YIM 130001]